MTPVRHEYRWLNPDGDTPPDLISMIEWRPVEPNCRIGQTVEDKCNELLAYRYKGGPVYEVRALYAAPLIRKALTGSRLEQLLEQLSLEEYQIRAIEAAHGIT